MFPEKFKVDKVTEELGTFANNDLQHIDREGAIHVVFSEGLKKSLFNYMHGICFEYGLNEWFEFNVPKTKVAPDYIEQALEEGEEMTVLPNTKMVWLGNEPDVRYYTKKKKGISTSMAELSITTKTEDLLLNVKEPLGRWLAEILPQLSINNRNIFTFAEFEDAFDQNNLGDIDVFMTSYTMNSLRYTGLLVI